MKPEAELAANVYTAAGEIERLAWEIPAPNAVTPRLFEVALALRRMAYVVLAAERPGRPEPEAHEDDRGCEQYRPCCCSDQRVAPHCWGCGRRAEAHGLPAEIPISDTREPTTAVKDGGHTT